MDRPVEGAKNAETNGDTLSYGGGVQPGGGMVEPNEFEDAIDEPSLPHDALAENLSNERSTTVSESEQRRDPSDVTRDTPQAEETVDPRETPDENDTGARVGDVSGYLGADRVVGTEPGEPLPEAEGGEGRNEELLGG